jgi:hypothetical protein
MSMDCTSGQFQAGLGLDTETGIVTLILYRHYLKIVGNNKKVEIFT